MVKPQKKESKQVSTFIAVTSVIGLTLCALMAFYKEVSVPLFLYAIFGGGILGTDNVLRFVKVIFRISDEKK